MSRNTRGARREPARYDLERAVAPHVDPAWAEAVILELRLLGVSGDRIGAALAEADAHCVDSGEPAVEALGEPVSYARSLGLPVEDDASRAALARATLPSLVQVLGMLAVLAAVPALRRGAPAELTVGHLGMIATLLVVVGATVAWSDQVLRAIIERPLLMLIPFGIVAGSASLVALATDVVVAVPAGAALACGAVVLAAGVTWSLLRHDGDASPLTLPTGQVPDGRGGRLAAHVTSWQVPAATAVLAGFLWWLAP